MPRLHFQVSVPPVPAPQRVVIVGTDRALGDWQPEKGFELHAAADGRFCGSVDVPYGLLSFKITRGSWETEESARDGSTPPNYHYLIAHDLTLHLAVEHWSDLPPWEPDLILGKTIDCELDATLLEESRRVSIWLPPGYMLSDHSQHPVLYLLDGQDSLHSQEDPGRETLCADDWVRRLALAGLLPEIILVAVSHRENFGERDIELSPQCDGPKLADFLVRDLKPFIDFTFCRDRVLTAPQHTGVLGFSLGGSLALFMAIRHGGAFGRFGCLSPCYEDLSEDTPEDCWILDQARAETSLRPDRKIYFDHGTLGGDVRVAAYQSRMDTLLRSKGFKEGQHFTVNRAEGAEHKLCSWRARLGAPLLFLFGEP